MPKLTQIMYITYTKHLQKFRKSQNPIGVNRKSTFSKTEKSTYRWPNT